MRLPLLPAPGGRWACVPGEGRGEVSPSARQQSDLAITRPPPVLRRRGLTGALPPAFARSQLRRIPPSSSAFEWETTVGGAWLRSRLRHSPSVLLRPSEKATRPPLAPPPAPVCHCLAQVHRCSAALCFWAVAGRQARAYSMEPDASHHTQQRGRELRSGDAQHVWSRELYTFQGL